MKLAIITGSSRGLGAALLPAFKREGWEVRGLQRPHFTLKQAAHSPETSLINIETGDYQRAVLVNNAASLHIGPADSRDIERELTANIIGPINLIAAFLKRWPHGEIVNVSSGVIETNVSGWSLYVTAKAAVARYVDALAFEGHKAINFDPGVMDTPMQAKIRDASFTGVENFRALLDDGKLRAPADVADELAELLR